MKREEKETGKVPSGEEVAEVGAREGSIGVEGGAGRRWRGRGGGGRRW